MPEKNPVVTTMLPDPKGPPFENQHRLIWAMTRSFLEADNYKHRKHGEKRRRRWSLFTALIDIFDRLIRMTPLYRRGLENAKNIVVNEVDLFFDTLPELFHGYTLLHLTDLHVDFVAGIEEAIRKRINGLHVDLCGADRGLPGQHRRRHSKCPVVHGAHRFRG